MKTYSVLGICFWMCFQAHTQVVPPENLVLEGIPPIPEELRVEASRYLDFRTAGFNDWHPETREMLITTRFADTMQLHRVQRPGGARHQLTFLREPVAGGSFRPLLGGMIVFAQDIGGGEFYQLYRYNLEDGRIDLLTDGKSRNSGPTWARSGKFFAYASTRRTGADTDIYVMEPGERSTDRLVLQVTGGGWSVEDVSPDEQSLLVQQYISINKSHLHLLDLRTGRARQLTPEAGENVAFANAVFARDGKSFYVTTDLNSEFMKLAEFALPESNRRIEKPKRVFTADINWNVDNFALSLDGKRIAFIANENGISTLYLLDTGTGEKRPAAGLPTGVISNPKWHANNRDLGFSITSAKLPSDAFSLNAETGAVERWTESETGGLAAANFRAPELITTKSFDDLEISAFVYRPDPARFPGRRPVLISIHGGPESQARPGFQARNNFYINELGLALVVPNVRGSSGYGKTFVTLDNGFKREDSVRDIGAILDWIGKAEGMDPSRVAVMGGSYGGYMVLASMQHYNERLKCGVDVVGISNFLTFLKNTQDYRRDLRRAEYGDERDPAMREFLGRISPTESVGKIKKPLLVVQGKNDPRVPLTESEQMVKAIRENGGTVWYLMAKDEGHGFARKRNADFQFLVTIQFLKQHLLD